MPMCYTMTSGDRNLTTDAVRDVKRCDYCVHTGSEHHRHRTFKSTRLAAQHPVRSSCQSLVLSHVPLVALPNQIVPRRHPAQLQMPRAPRGRRVLHTNLTVESRLRYRSRFAKNMYNPPQSNMNNVRLNLDRAARPSSIWW